MKRKPNIVERTKRTQKIINPAMRNLASFQRMKNTLRRWPQAWRVADAIRQSKRANIDDGSSHPTAAESRAEKLYEKITTLIESDPEEYMEGRGPRWTKLAREIGARPEQLRSIWRRKTADRN
jgi:hypothetical protein